MIQHNLRPAAEIPAIYLHRDPVDFRKSYRGLSQIVELELGHDPFSGMLYVFCNRHRNRIKCLFWERTGFVLYYKALSEDCLLYTSPSPRDKRQSRMPSSA